MAINQVPKDKPSFSVILGSGAVSNGTTAQNVTAAAGGGAAFIVNANVIPGVYSGNSINVSGISCGDSINPLSGDTAAFGVTSPQTSFIVYADAAWTSRPAPESNSSFNMANLVGSNSILAYSGYITNAAQSNLKTSTNGITWTTRTSFGTTSLGALSVANNIFFYSGAGSAVKTSTDGITWTTRTIPVGNTSGTGPLVAYGNSTYVAYGSAGGVATSTDAITWTTRALTANPTGSCRNLKYGPAGFIATYNGQNAYAYSTDGITWVTRSWANDTGAAPIQVLNSDSKYVVFTSVAGPTTRIYNSTNLTTWDIVATLPYGLENTESSAGYLNNLFVVVTDAEPYNLLVSSDGINWVTKNANAGRVDRVGYGNGIYIAGRSNGAAMSTSVDISGPVVNTAVVNLIGTKTTAIF
jgi:hypothetical protein